MDIKKLERIESYERWSGATAVSDHGAAIKRAEVSVEMLHRMADEELRRARQLLLSGVARVVLDISDPCVVERISSQLTPAEKNRIGFGTDGVVI